jgi:hypothetical protein
MVAEYLAEIKGAGDPPADWRGSDNWIEWREKLATLLATVLWPRYDPSTASWQGIAVDKILELTAADFKLLRELRQLHDATVTVGLAATVHSTLMLIEDDNRLQETLRQYLTGNCAPAIVERHERTYLPGLSRKAGTVDLQMKRIFQRPRAYQMAFMMGEEWFSHQHAKGAVSPALISGHCFQGAMGGVAAREFGSQIGIDEATSKALQRHAVDVGDRRVFAGVHYPSDNLSSWITALLIGPLVGAESVWLWDGIHRDSAVFARIDKAAATDPSSPFTPALRTLKFIGTQPGVTIDETLKFVQQWNR